MYSGPCWSSCRLSYTDERSQSYQLLCKGGTLGTLDGWETGDLAELVIPDLDMVEDPDRQTSVQPDLDVTPRLVSFHSQICDDPAVTGGKGASLGNNKARTSCGCKRLVAYPRKHLDILIG